MKNKFVLGLLSFLLFSFASCNLGVGLGGAVDALPPTMEIQNPALDSIIRGEFLIGGTWSDDGEVKSVSVVLERTDGLGTPFTFDGEITKDEETKTGTWSVVINPEEKNIIDGSYQATITAVDGGKHTTSITRQFKIDNTAPLIVLQRPSAKISDTAADSYGQSFTLVGQAADDNNISLINVEIYSDAECTNLVHTVPLQNVPNTINLDVAKFVENEENTYSAIYGSSKKEGTKPFYCKIIAYDDAQRYPIEGNQSAEDTYGNSTSTYFLYEEIATSVLSKFKLPEVYKIYSGEYFLTEENRAIEGVNDVETILDSKKIGSGYFSLNPANNPNFTVSGRDNLNLDGTDFTNSTNNLSSGGSLVIEVATGLDSIPVVGDSLKVYVQNCDSNGKTKGNKIYIENVQKSKSGTSYKLIATIVKSSDLIIGNDYIIGVEGKDESNNAIVTTGNGYGFHFAPSGVAPKFSDIATFINGQKSASENNLYVSALNPADKSRYTTIKLTGKVTSDDPNINLTIKLDDTVLETFKPEQIEGELYTFEKVYTTELISNPTISAQHEIEITAVNSSTTSDPISKIVMYDAINPEISIDESDTVLANKYDANKEDGTTVEGKYLNGTISLKFIISDDSEGTGVEVSGTNKPYFEIVDKDGNLQSIQLEGENESSTKHYIDKPAGQSFKIDTTTLQEGKTYFRVHGWDKAGNSYSYNGKDYFEEEYIIDQETDRPYIATNNETELRFEDFETKAELEAEKDSPGTTKANLFEKGTSVSVNISDDDLVKRYVFKFGKWEDGQDENYVDMDVPDGHYDNSENKEYGKTINKKSVSISQPLNATGWYKCSIVAYDVNDNASIERNFWILVTGYAPTVTVERTPERITTVTDASKLYAGAVTSFTNRIDIDSTDGPFVITRREVISLDETKPAADRFHDEEIANGITETTFTDTFIPFSGAIQKKVTYIVTDIYGHSGERTVSYQIDSSAPKVETISVPSITDTESKNYRFAAELSDAAASDEVSSGVSKVEYKFGSDGNVVTINSSSLNQTITFENEPYFATESNKEIWVRGIDSVGNIGEWKKAKFAYDKAAPALTFNNRPGSLPSTSYTLTGYVTEGFGMKANGTGTNAGKSVIKFEEYIGETKKAEKEILLTKEATESSKYTFSINLPITDGLDGDITYKVSAQDENNKDITGITEFTVNRDITAPVITVTTPSAATFGDSSISTETAVFRGDITELNPQSIFYQKKKANETAPTALTTANVLAGNIGEWTTVDISKLGVDGDGNGSWNFTTSFDSTPATRDGKWKLYIQSADKGGNICNMQTIDFCVDSAAPEIIVNIKNNESETPITATLDGSATIAVLSGSKYTISGTAKDTNGLKSFTINNSSVTVNADGTWSLPEVTAEGITEYKIVAIDNSGNDLTGTSKIEGKITQIDKSVIFDLNNPNAEITTLPSDNTWITGTGNVYIRGSASDASGIKDITVKINNSAAETIAVSDPWTYTLDCSKLSENDKTESSVHTMVVTVTDNCNKPTTITRKFKLDKTTPVLSNIVAADSKTKTKYTNNITDVVIEGFAYDGMQSNKRSVDKVIISAKDKDGNVVDLHKESESETENVATESVTPTTGSTNFGKFLANSKISTNNLGDGTYTFTISATDYAGTEVSEDFEIVVDKTPPTINSNILSDWSTKNGITWAEGTPHNGNRAKLTVSIKDDNTDSIYYFINDGSDSSINEPSKVGTSDWAPLNKVGDNYEGYLTFNDGTGTIYIKATDKAGNINYRQDLVYDVDTTDPEVCNLTSVDGDETVTSGTVLANGENNIVFTVQATDAGDAARVKSVDLSHLGSTKVSATGTYDETNEVWTIKIPKGKDNPKQIGIKDLADGVTHSVKVVVTDTAQNSKEYDLFKINMDKTAPVPSFTNIFDADKSITGYQVNGTITLSGNVSEANTIDSVVLEYLGKDDSNADKWFEVEHTNENVGTYTWTYAGIDTTKFPDNTTVKFRISATDKAKNTGRLEQDIVIAQDTDRPIVKFTNLTEKDGSYILKFGDNAKLEGSISDDDGTAASVVKMFIVSSEQLTTTPENNKNGWTKTGTTPEEIWTLATYGVTKFNKTTGEYSYTPANKNDGTKSVYFYIVDNNDKSFYTGYTSETPKAADALKRPYQQYKDSNKTDNQSPITYNSDSNNPQILDISVQAYSGSAGNEVAETEIDETTGETKNVLKSPGTSLVLGGTNKNWAKFIIPAYDANGIEGITLDLKYISKETKAATSETKDTEHHILLKSNSLTTSSYSGFTESGSVKLSSDGDFSTSTRSGEETPYIQWTTDFIDISNMKTGTVEGTVMVYDNSGLYGNSFPIFVADNDGPVINVTSPSSADESSGEVTIQGSSTDEGNARSATIEWLVPTAAQRASGYDLKALGLKSATNVDGWNDTRADNSSIANWKFKSNFLAQTKDDPLITGTSNYKYAYTKTADGVYTIPVYFRSVDTLGNVTVKTDYTIKYNPDADKPKTEIAYPSEADYDNEKSYVTLGGTIRVSGSVNIPDGSSSPYAVYIQIADATGNFDATAKGNVAGYGFTAVTQGQVASAITSGGFAELSDGNLLGFPTDDSNATRNAWWGIQANRSANSWSINLNDTGKMNPVSGTKDYKIRACAVNQKGKVGAWTDAVEIHIDNSAPSYEGILFQYSSTTETSVAAASTATAKGELYYNATPVAEKTYKTGMYIKGNWILRVKITDESDVQMDENAAKKKVGNTPENTEYSYHFIEKTDSDPAQMYVYIPVSESATYSLTARDNVASASGVHIINPGFDINVDNLPPTVTDITDTGDNNINMTKVSNSNYQFTFKTTASDAGSGFKMMAYYFRRITGGAGTAESPYTYSIELPLPPATSGGKTTYPTYKGNTNGSGALTLQDGLYGTSLTGTSATDVITTFTGSETVTNFTASTSFATNKSIRVGALIELAGSYYPIDSINGNVITVKAIINTAVTSAFVPAAFAIDNTTPESSVWSNGVQTITNDDGDGIFEYLKAAGDVTNLQTGVCSDQLEDGMVDIVCVAFDEAGNYSTKTTTVFLQNHTPRLSKVYLATDLNGNGSYSSDEFAGNKTNGDYKYFSALTDGNNVQPAPIIYSTRTGNGTSGSPYVYDTGLTMRDTLGVGLEFVGSYSYNETTGVKTGKAVQDADEGSGAGNGDIYYKIGVSTAALDTPATKANGETLSAKIGTISGFTSTAAADLKGLEIATNTTGLSTYEISSANKANPPLAYINISLWDSTPGTTPGVGDTKDASGKYTAFGSQWTVLNIPLHVDVVDDEKPTVSINNPQVKISTTEEDEVDDDGELTGEKITVTNALGHVDLGGTDNISGTVVFTGTVTDEKRISSLKFNSNVAFNKTAITNKVVGTYNSSVGYVTDSTNDTDENGIYSIALAEGVTFEVTAQTFDIVSGHRIDWKLEVDTSKVGTTSAIQAAYSGVVFTLTAGNSGDTDGTDVTSETKTVNIVPYVTGIKTSLDSFYSGNSSVYARTAQGHYIAYDKEAMSMTGFNLIQDATVTIKYDDDTNKTTTTLGALTSGAYPFTLPAGAKSGKVKVTVNNVDSTNNTNTNNAETTYYGSTTPVKQNMQANGVNNDNLTDDLEIDIWEFKTAANPRDGEILTPEMQIGPNGEVGFAFVNGNFYFNMAGPSTVGDTSQTANGTFASQRAYEGDYAQYFESALAFDKDGHTFGISTNQDSNQNYSANTTFYFGQRSDNTYGHEGWNVHSGGNYNGGAYRRRLQSTTSSVVNGVQDTSTFRAMSPSIAVVGNGTTSNVYTAFYDAVRKQIRYKYGVVQNGMEDTQKAFNISTYAVVGFDGRSYVHFGGRDIFNLYANAGEYVNKDSGYDTVKIYKKDGTLVSDKTYRVNSNSTGSWSNTHCWYEFVEDKTNAEKGKDKGISWDADNWRYVIRVGKETEVYTANHSLQVGDKVALIVTTKDHMNTVKNKVYYVVRVPDANHFCLSETAGGPELKLWEIEAEHSYQKVYVKGVDGNGNSPGAVDYKLSAAVTGQLLDVKGGENERVNSDTKYLNETSDQSVHNSLYSVVSTANLTKTTAAVAIGVTPASVNNGVSNDVVSIVWYDGKDLKYAYSTNPQTDDGATAGSNFTKVTTLPAKFSGAGYNVKMKVDTDGGIHLAFFTTSGAKLRYAYASSYAGSFTCVDVDTYALTTNDIGLDVAKDSSGKLVPYISYLSGNQLAKVAFPVAWNNNKATKAGIKNNKYTGDWEISVVPSKAYTTTNTYVANSKQTGSNAFSATTSIVDLTPKFDTICVGVHKDWATGVIAAIPTATTTTNVSADDADSNYSTIIGGNGTAHPALAYTVVGDDSLQFAQMK